MSATLGVNTLLYLPFCVFNYVSPIMSLIWGITGIKIERVAPTPADVEPAPRKSA
jgi:NhaC family Na+:H+ antiporter